MLRRNRVVNSTRIQNAANLATVFAALVAAGAFYYGYRQFSATQRATLEALELQKQTLGQERDALEIQNQTLDEEREAQAVDLFLKYNELMEQSISGRRPVSAGARFWRENRALSILETIFKLRQDDDGWKATVASMLGNHEDALKDGLDCKTFNPDFVKLVSQKLNRDVCSHE
jgi:uncharacterized protein HemX